MRFPKTIRFDASDAKVFDHAAAPDEWAVSGAFAFSNADPETLSGKARQAFANGFLGTGSFGRSTFVSVAEIDETEYQAVIDALADHFVAQYGAPDRAAARPAAEAEAAFAASLCDKPANTLLSVSREFGEDGIVERFHAIERRPEPVHTKIWEIVEDEE